MEKMKEAVVILCKCGRTHKLYGIRTEKVARKHWLMTWAFPIKEKTAEHEGYGTSIDGKIDFSDDYPGCPYCEQAEWVMCGCCGRLSCSAVHNGMFICEWCGYQGSEMSEYDGEEISAGTDA